MNRFRRAVLVLAALFGLIGLSGCEPPTRYVALGDSYTSGPLIPVQIPEAGTCGRSDHNYPHLMRPSLGVDEFRDASCGGAETEDMTQPQDVDPNPNPPQFNRLNADTTIVTLGIGGNDIGFSSIAESCLNTSPFGDPCKDDYVVDGRDEISVRIRATGPKIAAVIQGIHQRSPQAEVFVVGYPAILPEGDPTLCWPALPIAYADVPWLRNKEKELNAMLARRAAANDAHYVDTYTPSIGHDACQPPVIRWIEPAVPADSAYPVHPNLRGMEGSAAAVLAAMRAAGVI